MPPPVDPNEASGPDAREAVQLFLEAVRRNLPRVVFTTILFLLMGVFLTMLWPAKFQSETQFLLREVRIVFDADLLEDLTDIPLSKKLLSLTKELKSMNRVSAVLQELQWKEWLETAGNPARRKAFYLKVAKNLDVDMEADVTGGINATLTFQWTTRKTAVDFVNRLRDAWIKRVLDTHRQGLENRKEESERIVLDRQQAYNDSLEALRTYEEENRVPSLSTLEINHEMKSEYQVKLSDAQAGLQTTVSRLTALEQELIVIDPEYEVNLMPTDPEQGKAYLKLIKAEEVFSEIGDKYMPAHRKYKNAEAGMLKAAAMLKELGGKPESANDLAGNPLYLAKASQLVTIQQNQSELKALVDTYESELAIIDERLSKLPIVTMDLARLKEQVGIAATLLSEAKLDVQPLRDQVRLLRSSNSSVNQFTENAGGKAFEIIDIGIEPEYAVLPIGALIMALSLVLGVGLGLAGPVLAELTRSSFGSVKEVSRNLGVPVLGAVDMILTARDVRARTVQSTLTLTTMVLVLAALSTALFIYAEYPNVLPATVLRSLRDVTMALT